jgi:hypothetical protein
VIEQHVFVRGGGCMSRCICGRTFSDPIHGPQSKTIKRIRAEIHVFVNGTCCCGARQP